ncbi:MotA/TolQ/ExbB proton channel family protein [Bdellovibrionota bacterium FG-2]
MNFSSLFGLSFGAYIMYYALSSSGPGLSTFLDLHGFMIVFGGTAAAASISFPFGKVLSLIKVFILRVLGRYKADYQGVITQLLELNKKASSGVTGLGEALPGIKNEFLKEAVGLVSSGVLTEVEIRAALEQRLKTVEALFMKEANMFRTIGRFPPAFGLLATTLGMISVLQQMGQPEAQKLIGPAMSIGLIGTLYGITLANMVFLPIAENLSERTHEEVMLRKVIIEGALMLKAQVNPISMRENLNSFLLPKDRVVRKAA